MYAAYCSTEAAVVTQSNNPEREPSDWVHVEFSNKRSAEMIPQYDNGRTYELNFMVRLCFLFGNDWVLMLIWDCRGVWTICLSR